MHSTFRVNIIKLAVRDLDRSVRFYTDGLGCTVERRDEAGVTLRLGDAQVPHLELRPWDDLADELGALPDTEGFRGFMISAVFETAPGVDRLLEAAVRAGGTLVKPAKGAVWGYAGHFADPDGHLWKAVSSATPILAKFKRKTDTPSGPVMSPMEVAVTLGVPDIKAAKQFYADGLGYELDKAFGKFAKYKTVPGAATFTLYTRDALAADADVAPAGTGFAGYALGYHAASPQDVDTATTTAITAGAHIVSDPKERPGSGYTATFLAPDNSAWTAATR
ncbi:putative lactoylglutathione lyase [Catenulispora sp. GP43]|uniref:VOC family protein n=1 Tax=Catenulispora sp. GP43 TaxID=3156263 RepID=UPI00351873DB